MKEALGFTIILSIFLFSACGGGGGSSSSTPPNAPSGLSATSGDSQVTLSWNRQTDATYFNAYWATSSDVTPSNGNRISNVTGISYTHESLTNGNGYYYIVTAVNSDGESSASGVSNAMPLAGLTNVPDTTSNVAGTSGDAQITISWDSVTGATSYNLYYDTSSGVNTNTGTQVVNVTTPYILTGLTNNTTYYYI
ncbi:MAG: fibronectin type III domain-containing protein, partial [Nitrospinota bacterium]